MVALTAMDAATRAQMAASGAATVIPDYMPAGDRILGKKQP
jgi:hypothetical protein